MKISILSYDLSHNCLGRAYILAKVLKRSYDVEIIGPSFGEGIWNPVDSDEFEYVSVPGTNYPKFIFSIKKMLELINGDVIYAIKPRPTSYGIGSVKKLFARIPLVLDIDDWEVGFYPEYNKFQLIKQLMRPRRYPNAFSYTWLMEKLTSFADDITVSSSFLKNKFGGVIVPHGRDTNEFDPQKYDGNIFRNIFGFSDEKIIMFLGSPAPHKGIEDIVKAAKLLGRTDVKIVIVGANNNLYERKIKALGGNIIQMFGMQPFSKIPEFLSMANMVVLPQQSTSSAIGQVPAKVFDAMAMAKPIIATEISDLPMILDGCGLIVKPGDVKSLSRAMEYILENKNEAQVLGKKAREKCVKEYSLDRMQRTLQEIFVPYEY